MRWKQHFAGGGVQYWTSYIEFRVSGLFFSIRVQGCQIFLKSWCQKRWQKVAQNLLIFVHKAVFSDLKSSPKLAIKTPNSDKSQILGRQRPNWRHIAQSLQRHKSNELSRTMVGIYRLDGSHK